MNLLQDRIPGTIPAAEPPYLTQPFDAILEALGALQAMEAVPLIQPFLEHGVPRIQFAAARALYQLAADPAESAHYGDRLIAALKGAELQLRRTALADLGAIGYYPAAVPIAQTLAENSLKLIALKGILEAQLKPTKLDPLSEEAVQVMNLMDALL